MSTPAVIFSTAAVTSIVWFGVFVYQTLRHRAKVVSLQDRITSLVKR